MENMHEPEHLANILIVDEGPEGARTLASALHREGWRVWPTSSLEEARKVAMAATPHIAVIVSENEAVVQLLSWLWALPVRPEILACTNTHSALAGWAAARHVPIFPKPPVAGILVDSIRHYLGQRKDAPQSATMRRWVDSSGSSSVAPSTHEELSDALPVSSIPASSASGLSLVGRQGVFPTLPKLEEHVIRQAYRECAQNLSLTARTLGIPRSTLRDRLKRYGLVRAKAKGQS